MLKVRVLTAFALLAVLVLCMFFLPGYWPALMLIVMLVGAFEWANIVGFASPLKWLYVAATLIVAGMMLVMAAPGSTASQLVFALSLLFWLLAAPSWLAQGWQVKQPYLLALVGWVVLLPTWLALVHLRDISPFLLLALMAIVWIADTAAYFSGKKFGRHKLAPTISPGKTWEGVAGAVVGATLYAMAWFTTGKLSMTLPWAIVAVWQLTYFSILGDLFESWMKRQAGVKDSGQIFPGHGGVLDRIDALTSTLPIVAFVLTIWKTFDTN